MDIQLVLFDIGTRNFGVDVMSVDRVGQLPEIINKPKSPCYIEGQLNLCGCEMPVVDLHRWFGLHEQERTEDSRVMVANINGMKIGMIVSKVTDVVYIDDTMIKPPTKETENTNLECVLGFANIDEHLVTLVDFDRVLTSEEKDQLDLFQIKPH
ncbi:MAG: purine-binding chemotaxis protein CheW [Labilibaculum sp.]|nr:chemotaxis protein CheW [Labilibaculum sp.]MBI9060294.1 purine-binding chemotaxis protein CheW [Labilibaculum sp.]